MRTIRLADNEPVRALFISAQREIVTEDTPLNVRVSLKKYVDSVLMGDLARPSAHYSRTGRRFWVVESQTGNIVATAAIDKSDGTNDVATLARLVVSPEFRRKGLARLLALNAERWAAQHGYRTLALEVTDAQLGAQALYDSLGFKRLGTFDYGAITVFQYEKALVE